MNTYNSITERQFSLLKQGDEFPLHICSKIVIFNGTNFIIRTGKYLALEPDQRNKFTCIVLKKDENKNYVIDTDRTSFEYYDKMEVPMKQYKTAINTDKISKKK